VEKRESSKGGACTSGGVNSFLESQNATLGKKKVGNDISGGVKGSKSNSHTSLNMVGSRNKRVWAEDLICDEPS